MRFVILTAPCDPGDTAMTEYHEELLRAGVLLAGDVTAGFWLLELDSRASADEWARRVPCGEVEIREVSEAR
jgi:hypothetical protein